MTETEVLKLFKQEKALLTGHFLLSSGLHSPHYLQCAVLLQKPWLAEKLCKALAKKLKIKKIDAVLGPALGGVIVSHEMGRALRARALFAERLPAGRAGVDGTLMLRRGFHLEKNEKVLVVEDVVTTGKSTREVIDIVRQAGARCVGVAALVDRSGFTREFEDSLTALLRVRVETYTPEACLSCREGTLLVKPGSRPI